MSERITPLSRLGDASSEHLSERAEQLEKNKREHFDLRLRFAEAVSQKKGISLVDAMRDFTDLYRRLTGEWSGESVPAQKRWDQFANETMRISDNHEALLDCIVQYAEKRPGADIQRHESDHFFPFRYQYDETHHAIDLHFGSNQPSVEDPSAPGLLSKFRLPEMRQKLREMFTEIKHNHPDAEIVRGGSWLYNRESYRRLYPASYTAHPRIRPGTFIGGGIWGQFRDKTGGVNDGTRQQFLHNLEQLDANRIGDAFPYKALMVSASITDFYKEYGIE